MRKNAKQAYKDKYKSDRKAKISREQAKKNAKAAMDESYRVDKVYNKSLKEVQDQAGIALKELSQFTIPELKGKVAFTYKGKEYKYTGTLGAIKMQDGKGNVKGYAKPLSVDISLEEWNRLDDRYIQYNKESKRLAYG